MSGFGDVKSTGFSTGPALDRPVDGELSLSIVQQLEDRRKELKIACDRLDAPSAEEAMKKIAVEYMALCQLDGLSAIRDLAVMKISDNSQQNHIKLAAAKLLAYPGGQPEQGAAGNGSLAGVLAELNADFHKKAPRIKSVRERVVTFEEPDPKLIN